MKHWIIIPCFKKFKQKNIILLISNFRNNIINVLKTYKHVPWSQDMHICVYIVVVIPVDPLWSIGPQSHYTKCYYCGFCSKVFMG